MMYLSEIAPTVLAWSILLMGTALLLAGWFVNRRESRRLRTSRDEHYSRFLAFLAEVRSARN
jgi:hypothetical protein